MHGDCLAGEFLKRNRATRAQRHQAARLRTEAKSRGDCRSSTFVSVFASAFGAGCDRRTNPFEQKQRQLLCAFVSWWRIILSKPQGNYRLAVIVLAPIARHFRAFRRPLPHRVRHSIRQMQWRTAPPRLIEKRFAGPLVWYTVVM